MVFKKDCVHYTTKMKKHRGIGSPSAKIEQMPICNIGKNTVGGCPETCRFYSKR